MVGIYKITSPSKKVYIGQSINIKKRFDFYKKLQCKKQTKIYNSLNKYGVANHVFEIICQCEILELNELERYYQELYNVINNGLNCRLTETKDKIGIISKESKEKISMSKKGKKTNFINIELRNKRISESLTGKKLSIEHRLACSKGQTGLKRSPEAIKKSADSRRGLKMSNDAKNKISNSQKSGNNSFAKITLNIETGIFYETSIEAAQSIGLTYNCFNHYINGRTKRKLPFIYV